MTTEGPFICYRELLSGNVTTTSAFFKCNFNGHNQLYLAVSSISNFSVYAVYQTSTKQILVLCTQNILYGNVRDLKCIGTQNLAEQLLLLTFDIGKFVIVKFDPILNIIVETALYNAEENALGIGSDIHALNSGIITSTEPFTDTDITYGISCGVVYSNQLYFIPTPKSTVRNNNRNNNNNIKNYDMNFTTPFVIDLKSQLLLTGTVLDICFISGYSHPTLAVLQNTDPLPIGHANHVMHTCTLTYLTIDTTLKQCIILWHKKYLPHDCIGLIKLSDNYIQGSVGIITMNAMLIANSSIITGIATNGFANTTVHSSIKLHPSGSNLPCGLELDASRWCECDDLCLIGYLKNGEIVMIQMILTPNFNLSHMSFDIHIIARGSSNSTCLIVSPDRDLWFMSARQSDGILIQVSYQYQTESTTTTTSNAMLDKENISENLSMAVSSPMGTMTSSTAAPTPSSIVRTSTKKSRFSSTSDQQSMMTSSLSSPIPYIKSKELIQEEIDMYGEALLTIDSVDIVCKGGRKVTMNVLDSLASMGPILHGLFTTNSDQDSLFDINASFEWSAGKKSHQHTHHTHTTSTMSTNLSNKIDSNHDIKDTLILSTGLENDGALTRINQGIKLSKLNGKDLPGALATFSIDHPVLYDGKYALLLLSFIDKSRIFAISSSYSPDITTNAATAAAVSPTDMMIKELPTSQMGLIANETTISTGIMSISDRLIVQITSSRLRLIRLPQQLISVVSSGEQEEEVDGMSESEALQDMILNDDEELGGLGGKVHETIVQADIRNEYILLLTSYKSVYVLKYQVSEESIVIVHTGTVSNHMIDNDVINHTDKDESMMYVSSEQNDHISLTDELNKSNDQVKSNLSRITLSTYVNENLMSVKFVHSSVDMKCIQPVSSTSINPLPTHTDGALSTTNTQESKDQKIVTTTISDDVLMREAIHMEELFLYGQTISSSDDNNNTTLLNTLHFTSIENGNVHVDLTEPQYWTPNKSQVDNLMLVDDHTLLPSTIDTNNQGNKGNSTDLYIMFVDALGQVTIVNLNNLSECWSIHLFGGEKICQFQKGLQTTTTTTTTMMMMMISDSIPYEQLLCDVSFVVLSTPINNTDTEDRNKAQEEDNNSMNMSDDSDIKTLCLIGLYDTGDVLIYYNPIYETTRSQFIKLNNPVITHRFRHKHPKFKTSLSSTALPPNTATSSSGGLETDNSPQSPYLVRKSSFSKHGYKYRLSSNSGLYADDSHTDENHSIDPAFTFANLSNYRLESIENIHQSNGVLIPGTRPSVVLLHKGYPLLLPFSYPELPYANPGIFTLSSIRLNSMSILLSLWQESAGSTMAVRRILQMYHQPSISILYHGSIISTNKIEMNTTVNYCLEILNRTDDKKEQALLQKKTYILACCDHIKKPFTPEVLTEDEKKLEEESYDRFFPNLTSFCQPNETVAPPPLLDMTQHKLVITQHGMSIDEYMLKEYEQILGLEVLYLYTEKLVEPVLTAQQILATPFIKPPPIIVPSRRIFIGVSTLFEDKHGEDTQGEGRLLIFSLDYKLFEKNIKLIETVTVPNEMVLETNKISDGVIETKMDITLSSDDNFNSSNSSNNSDDKKEDETNHDTSNTTTSNGNTTTNASNGHITAVSTTTEITTIQNSMTIPLNQGSSNLITAVESIAQSQFLDSIQPKLRLHWTGPGPASTVTQMGQYVISTVGYSVFIYKLNKDTLEMDQVSFHYAKFFIASITIIKNYIILADVCNSLQFLVWREEDLSLTLLGKDYDSHISLCSAYIVDGKQLGIVLSDTESNIQIMQFNPRKIESLEGSRLLTLCDFHLGSDANTLLMHNMLIPPPIHASDFRPPPPPIPVHNRKGGSSKQYSQVVNSYPTAPFGTKLNKNLNTRTCIVIGTIDGGIGVLLPIDEKTYRSLSLLQQIMSIGVKTTCSLNQKEYRLIKSNTIRLEKKCGVLDGTLLWQYNDLSWKLQYDLATVIGSSRDIILDNLARLDTYISFF